MYFFAKTVLIYLYIKIDDKEHLQYNCKYCNCVYMSGRLK